MIDISGLLRNSLWLFETYVLKWPVSTEAPSQIRVVLALWKQTWSQNHLWLFPVLTCDGQLDVWNELRTDDKKSYLSFQSHLSQHHRAQFIVPSPSLSQGNSCPSQWPKARRCNWRDLFHISFRSDTVNPRVLFTCLSWLLKVSFNQTRECLPVFLNYSLLFLTPRVKVPF